MKNILIIYPHWPPSNLVGTLRPRFIANYLYELGWQPIVLTVNPLFYEEPGDLNLLKTVSKKINVEYVEAKPIKKVRIIGDIGLRSYGNLKKRALILIKKHDIKFIWISIPSFYTATLGRYLQNKTGVPFGIDYQDPWVRNISNRKNIRALLSNLIARVLEPYAVKKAALISGVSKSYYEPVLKKYFAKTKVIHVHMPVGFDPNDYKIVLENINYPWDTYKNCKPLVYAGAFLPLSGYFTELLFKSIKKLRDKGNLDPQIKLFFIGTGNYTHKSVTAYAKDAGIEDIVIEIRDRYPFLQILNFLSRAYGILIIGSTEKHYTASKIFQSVLSKRPVFSVFHTESSAVRVLKECNAAQYTVKYQPKQDEKMFFEQIEQTFYNFIEQKNDWQPDFAKLDKYSAKESARVLAEAIDKCISKS